MAVPPRGMHIFTVLPQYYDAIIEASKGGQEEYTLEHLEIMRRNAQERNSVAIVMFMDPTFWIGPPTHHPDDEIDFNTIVSKGDNGLVQHTYNPACDPGCYGQLDSCIYKRCIGTRNCVAEKHANDCPHWEE
jgi:hypothetical protein